jgi:probable poly-beta-1,6-N-acetyl-D-glucosamine export protein
MQRNFFIDYLRGFAMLVMMLTHVTAYYPSNSIAFALWNWSHFAVPIFLFCSAYLFFQKSMKGLPTFFPYVKKRFLRLLVPYYLFLLFFLPTLYYLTPNNVTFKYIVDSFLLTGGVDINWLVLLFLLVTILVYGIVFFWQKARVLFWGFFGMSFLSVIILLFVTPAVSYKWIMWLPWSFVLYVIFFYILFEKKHKYLISLFLFLLGGFSLSYFVRDSLSQSVILIHNKYPPNSLYLFYSMSVMLFILFLLKRFSFPKNIAKILSFFSRYSYQIYFVHYFVLIVFATFLPQLHWSWEVFFLVVVAVTVTIQLSLLFLKKQARNVFALS